jgi:hypothetical protein
MSKKYQSKTFNLGGIAWQLRHATVVPEMTEETICFVGDLYADDEKVGEFKNEGHGGDTWPCSIIDPKFDNLNELLGQFERWPDDPDLKDFKYSLKKMAEKLAYDILWDIEDGCPIEEHKGTATKWVGMFPTERSTRTAQELAAKVCKQCDVETVLDNAMGYIDEGERENFLRACLGETIG